MALQGTSLADCGCAWQFVFRQLLTRAEERTGFQFKDMEYVDAYDGQTVPLQVHPCIVANVTKATLSEHVCRHRR